MTTLTVQTKAQIGRFVRLFVSAVIATGILGQVMTGGWNRTAIVAAIVGALEVAWRSFSPVVPANWAPPAPLPAEG